MQYLYFENTSGNHNKFYEMSENSGGQTFTATWGKIGTAGVTKDYSMDEWYKKKDEKIKKGYIDVSYKGTPPGPKYTLNKDHLKRVDKVLMLLTVHANDIYGHKELSRDVGAIRNALKDKKSPELGSLNKNDMTYLNDVWKKIRHYVNKN